MELLDRVADEVAQQVLDLVEATGDEDIIDEIKKVIGSSSQTLEEAYMTSIRVRRAEKRAYAMLAEIRGTKGLE